MAGIDLGAAHQVSWVLGTAGLTVELRVTLPDGTTTSPTVAETSGAYSATVDTPHAGRYLLSWATVGPPAAAYSDILDVWPADPRFLISLQDARQSIQYPGIITGDDAELRLFIAAATPVIEDIVGAVLTRTITQTTNGGKTGVALWERPSTRAGGGVTSVTVNGVALQETGYTVDPDAAIVYCGSSTAPARFAAGRRNVVIVYETGTEVIPPNIRLATSELVRHLWQVGHQGQRPDWSEPAAATGHTPSGFAVPKRVIELCSASPRLPGIA